MQLRKTQTIKHPATRRHTRFLFSVPVMLRYLLPEGLRTTRGMSVDISEGGMAAVVQAGLHVGETVEVNLALPSSPLHTLAIVRYVAGGRSGFEFLGLTMEQRSKISHATVAV